LVHFNYASVGQFVAKQRVYAAIQARSMWRAGIRPRHRNFVLQPAREFWRRLWRYQGYRDGWRGLVLASLMGYYTLVTYLALRGLWGRSPRSEDVDQRQAV